MHHPSKEAFLSELSRGELMDKVSDLKNALRAKAAQVDLLLAQAKEMEETHEWDYQDKVDKIQGLQSALKEVYALAGEDPQLAKIINRALEAYPFP